MACGALSAEHEQAARRQALFREVNERSRRPGYLVVEKIGEASAVANDDRRRR